MPTDLPADGDGSWVTELLGHDLWTAHEHPERPFARGMWLCDCDACLLALRAEVAVRPTTTLVLKTNADRIAVTAELLLEAVDATGGTEHAAESLCYVAGDWVREVFVADPPGLLPPARWWSMACRGGRAHRRSARPRPEAAGAPDQGRGHASCGRLPGRSQLVPRPAEPMKAPRPGRRPP